MVRLKAPHGGKSYSYGGVEHQVGEDGTVDVEPHVAAVLKSHGFINPILNNVRGEATITRDEVVSMLNDLGVAVNSSILNMETLVDALKAACKAKAHDVANAASDLVGSTDDDAPASDSSDLSRVSRKRRG